MMILSWEPNGDGLFGVASRPWVTVQKVYPISSPGIADARKAELFILTLTLTLTLALALTLTLSL